MMIENRHHINPMTITNGKHLLMDNTPQTENTAQTENTPTFNKPWNRNSLIRSVGSSLLINTLFPFVIYTVLKHYSVSDFTALVLTSIPSLLDSLVGLLIRRRIDALAMLVLAGIVISLGLIALGGSPRLLLVRESLLTSAFGVLLLLSLFLRRTLAYYVFRQMLAGNNLERRAWFESLVQQNAPFRAALRMITAIWGAGLTLEGLARVIEAFTLSIAQFLLVSPTVNTAIIILTFACTGLYVRSWRNKHGSIMDFLKK